MGTNNGKFFDAKLSGEYYDILLKAKKDYDKKADAAREANDDFEANDRFTGDSATGLKKFIKYGIGNLIDDQTDLYNELITVQKNIMQAFADKIDSDLNARIEYDTLEKINTDFKGFYSVFDENAKAVFDIINDLNDEFGTEIEGGFPQPNSKTGRERYINICGGDDSGAGYFKDCQDKLVNFDAEMKQYLDSKNIPFIYDDITRRVKATSSILGGYHYDSPEFDGKKELVIDTPRVKAIKEVDLGFDNFCSDIDKLLDKRNFKEPEIDPATGFPVNSFRCSFEQLEKSNDPLVKRAISSPHYRTFKQMVMETSKPLSDDPNTYMITPNDAAMAFGVGGAVKSYKELGNLSELEKNARSNYAAFKNGGVDYMVNYVAGQVPVSASFGTANASDAAVLMNLLNTGSSSANTLPDPNTVKGLLSGANPAVVNSQIANLWNIIGQGMGNQNPAAFMNGLYKNSGAVALMSCSAAKAKSSGKALKKQFTTDQELADYLDEQFGILCDDNDSNDKEAKENIDACMGNFICEKEVDGKRYVAYDKEKIEKTLAYCENDGLAYQLLDSIDNKIIEDRDSGAAVPGAIKELGLGGNVENTQLNVKKDGAGVRLEVTCNNDWLPGKEIKNEPVAYACTEESAENYFTTHGENDWDAINDWIKKGAIDETSIEYDVFGQKMIDMSDKEIENLLNNGMYSNTTGTSKFFSDYYGATTYSEGENIQIASQRYAAMMNIVRNSEGYDDLTLEQKNLIDNNEARSIAVLEATKRMAKNGGLNMHVDLSTEDKDGENAYIIQINATSSYGQSDGQAIANMYDSYTKSGKITVYPRASTDVIDSYMHDQTIPVLQSDIKPIYSHKLSGSDYEKIAYQMVKILAKQSGKYVGETASGTVSIALKGVDIALKGKETAEDYKKSVEASTAAEALSTGENAMSMCIEGTVIYTTGNTSGSVQIYGLEYNENELRLRTAAYNIVKGQNMTVEQLKEHFVNGDADFQKYSSWYYTPHRREQCKNYEDALREIIETKYNCKLEDATDGQINDASQELSEIIKDTGTNELLNKDYTVIEKAIEESGG